MPRYCAVRVCKNRGGTASEKDNKKFSFYPFPLRDKSRLQKWVDNMKREEWVPSRHQYLCSEHFTEECFDIRWGIRYLKTTAIPTIFPSAEDEGDKKFTAVKRSTKANPSTSDTIEPTDLNSSETTNVAADNTEIFEPPPVLETSISYERKLTEIQTASCETSNSSGKQIVPSLPLPQSEEGTDPNAHQAALGHAFSFVSTEKIKDTPLGCILEETRFYTEEQMTLYEHSYCRRDADKNHLWNKILTLHAKILELGRREELTVAKIHALETEISILKRDRTVFKDKQKDLENYI